MEKIEKVQNAINVAVTLPPPESIDDFCHPYYSPYYYLMGLLANDAELCVELGIETGRGIFAMATMSHARIVGIDEKRHPKISRVEHLAGVELYFQSSTPAFDLGQPIDVLHIDTEHSETRARDEFRAWEPYLADGAVVLFDDLNAMEGGVARAFNEMPGIKIRDDRLHPVCGYGLLIYKG